MYLLDGTHLNNKPTRNTSKTAAPLNFNQAASNSKQQKMT